MKKTPDTLEVLLNNRDEIGPPLPPSEERMARLAVTPVPDHLTTSLAPPANGSLAALNSPIVLEALDKAHADAISEIDLLIEELNRLKDALDQNHEGVKDQLGKHFALAAEAHGFTERVRTRLCEVGGGNANRPE